MHGCQYDDTTWHGRSTGHILCMHAPHAARWIVACLEPGIYIKHVDVTVWHDMMHPIRHTFVAPQQAVEACMSFEGIDGKAGSCFLSTWAWLFRAGSIYYNYYSLKQYCHNSIDYIDICWNILQQSQTVIDDVGHPVVQGPDHEAGVLGSQVFCKSTRVRCTGFHAHRTSPELLLGNDRHAHIQYECMHIDSYMVWYSTNRPNVGAFQIQLPNFPPLIYKIISMWTGLWITNAQRHTISHV